MKRKEWRILVGEDAKAIDQWVRNDPENAYEITFHGEKLYPMNLKFPNHNHIIVVELSKLRNGNLHSGNCTTHIPDLDYETFTHNHYPTMKVFYT